jgi:hypothetical protein
MGFFCLKTCKVHHLSLHMQGDFLHLTGLTQAF